MSIRIRVMTGQDIAAGLRLCEAAGWNQLADDWSFFISTSGWGAFLAEKDGRATGTAAFARYDNLAWIAMMLVDPAERRAGIGAQLLEAALDAVRDAPCVGLDATPLGEPLYRRYGLVNHYSLVRTSVVADPARLPSLPGNVRPMNESDLAAAIARDRCVFGAGRASLLESLYRRAPECAWIADRGYCFGRPGRLFHQLGPLVADDRETAAALVAACLTRSAGKTFALDAPLLDPQWIAWLEAAGFTIQRPFVRMFRAGDRHPGLPGRQYGIAGPEFA